MGFDQVLDDGEAESGAARRPGTGRIDPVEPLEEAGQVFARDARSRVPDLEDDAVPSRRDAMVIVPPLGV